MPRILLPCSLLSLVFSGAIFGFFYAWVCSTMWGLDAADPRVAIAAMQAMNASVRNPVFFPAFFLTPAILGLTALAAASVQYRAAALWFGLAAVVYLLFGMLLTMMVNVPMNEALAMIAVPEERDAAAAIWRDYSGSWQAWNAARMVASGLALTFAGMGLWQVGRSARRS